MSDLGSLDHDRFVRRACELARTAGERGDKPFGSVLVVDGEVVMEEKNREKTDADLANHPELTVVGPVLQDIGEAVHDAF